MVRQKAVQDFQRADVMLEKDVVNTVFWIWSVWRLQRCFICLCFGIAKKYCNNVAEESCSRFYTRYAHSLVKVEVVEMSKRC
jgi:hypothetical protein